MNPNKLIIINTIVTYGRTILTVCLSLYSTRWVLQELGEEDFGLYSLVGSLLIVLAFLSEKIISGVSRFYAYEIGRQNHYAVQKYFNSAISINLIFSVFFILIALTIGEYLIYHLLTIPTLRIQDSIIVLRISVISTAFSLLAVPYTAMFTAKQNLLDLSLILTFQGIFVFIGTYCMRFFHYDKLLLYASIMCIIYIFTYTLQICRARYLYSECRIKTNYMFDKKQIKELTKFSFWNLLADLGHLIRTQGISILTNLFFSTNGNAALGIANRVASQSSSLTNALSNALSPAIISNEGENNKERVFKLALFSPKIGIILMLFFSVPLITEINNILTLWLGIIPKGTEELCICTIIMFLIEKTTLGLEILLQAKNKIARSQTYTAVFYSASILFAYLMIQLHWGLISIGIACILSMILSRISIVLCAQNIIQQNLWKWFKHLIIPTLILCICLFTISYMISCTNLSPLIRLIINFISNIFFTIILSFYFFMNKSERISIINLITKYIKQNKE